MPKSTQMNAIFAGKCVRCGTSFAKGATIYYARGFGAKCTECGPHNQFDQPRPKKAKATRKAKAAPTPAPAPAPAPSSRDFSFAWESVSAAVDSTLANGHGGNRERIRSELESSLCGSSRWGNYFTRDRLLGELSNPSAALLDAVREMRDLIAGDVIQVTAPRRKVRRGQDCGEELDVDRWANREPNAWDRSIREPQAKRTVRIGCNLAVSYFRRPEELLWRGAAAMALADYLTVRGLNVEIVAIECSTDRTDRVGYAIVSIVAKHADMPLDENALALSLCEIAFSRIVTVLGGAREMPGKLSDNLGFPASARAEDVARFDYFIDSYCLTREAAADWLAAQTTRPRAD